MPVIKEVPMFKPMWKLNKLPIKFVIKISIPPKIELPIILAITFNGNKKNLPITNKKIIQAIYTIIELNSNIITY